MTEKNLTRRTLQGVALVFVLAALAGCTHRELALHATLKNPKTGEVAQCEDTYFNHLFKGAYHFDQCVADYKSQGYKIVQSTSPAQG